MLAGDLNLRLKRQNDRVQQPVGGLRPAATSRRCDPQRRRYLRFKVQHPTSDNTDITTGSHKITLEGPVPLYAT